MPPSSSRPVLCFGAIHRDTIAHANQKITQDTSTPSKITEAPGGVAANTARVLARLGIETHLAGLLGNDSAGTWLTYNLRAEGIGLWTRTRVGQPTGSYLALHDPDGGLAAACVDDRILGDADGTVFDDIIGCLDDRFLREAIWFADANCPPPVLVSIARRAPAGGLVANAVSNAKAHRLKAVLADLDLVFLNRAEAAALTGTSKDRELPALAAEVKTLGIPRIVLTDSTNGVFVSTADESFHLKAPKLGGSIADVTGAGDALTGGTLGALSRGFSLKDAVQIGQKAAALTLQSPGAVAGTLSWTEVTA